MGELAGARWAGGATGRGAHACVASKTMYTERERDQTGQWKTWLGAMMACRGEVQEYV
jgi:hypothetical protein